MHCHMYGSAREGFIWASADDDFLIHIMPFLTRKQVLSIKDALIEQGLLLHEAGRYALDMQAIEQAIMTGRRNILATRPECRTVENPSRARAQAAVGAPADSRAQPYAGDSLDSLRRESIPPEKRLEGGREELYINSLPPSQAISSSESREEKKPVRLEFCPAPCAVNQPVWDGLCETYGEGVVWATWQRLLSTMISQGLLDAEQATVSVSSRASAYLGKALARDKRNGTVPDPIRPPTAPKPATRPAADAKAAEVLQPDPDGATHARSLKNLLRPNSAAAAVDIGPIAGAVSKTLAGSPPDVALERKGSW